ncbi:MAG: hypothetical protein SPF83_13760 [Butyricimonas virosa]|uniref:hypothetical protein n=1 Tax=Butyricimonas virosa TaxID=544645 RepID=UPI00242A8C55|nr:hypothetical protein [Butyricimonas virosa]MDY5534715.1 hypothetical protein [Butyricimonas virosa]
MRYTIYLIATSIAWLFSACQDVTIGYLETDAAKYSVDTMHIVANATNELQRLEGIETDFYTNTSTLQDKIAGLEEELEDLQYELEGSDEYWDAYDELGGTDIEDQFWNDEISFEEYTELIDQVLKELDDRFGITPLKESLEEAQATLENLAVEMGIGSLEILKKQIAEYQQKIDYNLPWTSAKIEGVEGTQPLLFTVIGVKSANTGEAQKFMNHVGVLGDGTIYVELDMDVIPGNYTVSLQVENEGRTKILNDMFTFVVDAPIQETPIEE